MFFKLYDIGLVDYQKGLDFQKEVFEQVKSGLISSGLILCRHYPVITLGRLARKQNILLQPSALEHKAIALCQTNRGGDVTYHDQAQLTVYPIVNLSYFDNDIHLYLRRLEEVVIGLLSDFGIIGLRRTGLTGVWVGNRKICSIGIAIKSWITFHGLSFNVKKEGLRNFSWIRPCGMDIEMTALEELKAEEIDFDTVKMYMIQRFQQVFDNCSSNVISMAREV